MKLSPEAVRGSGRSTGRVDKSATGSVNSFSGRSDPACSAWRVVRAERQQLGSVVAQPVALPAPVRAMSLDERPEPSRVVRNPQVTELVHDDVVEYLERREREPPVE